MHFQIQSSDIPFGQASQEVPAGALLNESSDSEPAGLAVIAGPAIAGDGIFDYITARAGGFELGRRGQVADQGDLGNIAAGRGAEGTGEARGSSSCAAGEEGHLLEIVCGFVVVRIGLYWRRNS